jgi:hypothetical protein
MQQAKMGIYVAKVHAYNDKTGPPPPSSMPNLGIEDYFEEYISEEDRET